MIVINNVDSQKFTFNGVEYFKNFTPVVVGNKIRVLNTCDSSIELTDAPRLYSDFEVDGVVYASVSLLQTALLPILYTRNSLVGDFVSLDLKFLSNERVSTTNSSRTLVREHFVGKLQDYKKIKFHICTNRVGSFSATIIVQLTPVDGGTSLELLSSGYNNPSGNFSRFLTTIDDVNNVVYHPQTALFSDIGDNAAFNSLAFDPLKDYNVQILMSIATGGEMFLNSSEIEFLK